MKARNCTVQVQTWYLLQIKQNRKGENHSTFTNCFQSYLATCTCLSTLAGARQLSKMKSHFLALLSGQVVLITWSLCKENLITEKD